jgi:hypothetical protein
MIEVIVRFVDVGEIVDNHHLNILIVSILDTGVRKCEQ